MCHRTKPLPCVSSHSFPSDFRFHIKTEMVLRVITGYVWRKLLTADIHSDKKENIENRLRILRLTPNTRLVQNPHMKESANDEICFYHI